MAPTEDRLFPDLPEDITALSDEDLGKLRSEYETAKQAVLDDDAAFLKGLEANEIIAQFEAAATAYKSIIVPETAARAKAHENFVSKREELSALFNEDEPAPDPEPAPEGDEDEVVAEAEEILAEATEVEVKEEERELVTASAEGTSANGTSTVRFSRTPPAPSPERVPVTPVVEEKGAALVASGGFREAYPQDLDALGLASLMKDACIEYGPAEHNGQTSRVEGPHGTVVFDGPRVKTAKATFEFPGDRTLNNAEDDIEKIRAVLPANVEFLGQRGGHGGEALVASGGLCAPLEPLYTMPNFATEAEPVWEALPVFRARRGGINVPTPTYIADITTAISSISEANDALGGTFATKSCQDLTCPDYTETAIQILAHCREYGNLNARAWPEKIAHENALTMAALSRTSENFMLARIKSLSIAVTNGASTLSALTYIVDGAVREAASIRYLLRMDRGARFRAIFPVWLLDLLLLDTVNTQFDRYRSKGEIEAYLRSTGIDPVWHLDAQGGVTAPFAAESAGTADCFPTSVQWALHPEGEFLGIDSGVLELGIVRDSTLNITNDFQVFGERFRNVARIGPAQAARWVTTTLTPAGQFPPAGTAYTCS